MSEANFSLKLIGPALDDGEIDVHDLAPALLAMGDLFQAANTAINGERAKASVKVRATSRGSFEVDLTLIQTLKESVKTLFDFAAENNEGIAAANDLADLILKVGAPMEVAFSFF